METPAVTLPVKKTPRVSEYLPDTEDEDCNVSAKSSTSDLKTEWIAHFDRSTCSPEALAKLDVPTREPILGEWFKQGDLGFIYGPRGLGKTWLAMHLARQIAEGGQVAEWKAHTPRQVLYVDGEMPLDGIRERDMALTGSPTNMIQYLQHEALFHLIGKVPQTSIPSQSYDRQTMLPRNGSGLVDERCHTNRCHCRAE